MGNLVNEILAQLRLITELKFVTVWNNQFQYMEDGTSYSFPMPCAFVEIENNNSQQLSGNFQGSDLNINIHIGQNVLNGDLLDENLTIFSLRDLIVKSLANFKPTTASLMVKISEGQDFDHTNIYHYTIGFTTHWIDNTAVNASYYSSTTTNPILTPITTHT